MRYGIALRTYEAHGDLAHAGALVSTARLAEDLGYDSIWAADHITVPNDDLARLGERWLSPLVLLSYLAAHTSRIRLGTDVLVIPYRHPLFVAQTVAALDQLSQGRVILGVGTGYIEPEFHALGVDYESRGSRMDDHLRALKRIWTTSGAVSYTGDYVAFENLHVEPKPVQRPHPPLLAAGNGRRVVRRAVELADGWHPLEPSFDELDASLEHMARLCEKAGRSVPPQVSISFRPLDIDFDGQPPKPRNARNAQNTRNNRKLLHGTPDQVMDDVQALQRRGVAHLVLRFQGGAGGAADVARAMERFVREIVEPMGD